MNLCHQIVSPCDPDNAAGHQADAGLVRAGRVAAHPAALGRGTVGLVTFIQPSHPSTHLREGEPVSAVAPDYLVLPRPLPLVLLLLQLLPGEAVLVAALTIRML